MKNFNELVSIIERLLAPDGCPWDREQTLSSMRSSLLEETSEVIEAINLNEPEKIEEELGDLFFNVVFLCKLAEKEHLFTLEEVMAHISAKLIRRHPHIFGDAKVKSSEEVLKQWEEIKKVEKGNQAQKHLLEGIPKNLPSLARAQKIIKRLKNSGEKLERLLSAPSLEDEDSLGKLLFNLVAQASQKGLDAEQGLSKFLSQLEQNLV